MSQSYKTIQRFQTISVSQTLLNVQPAGSSATLGSAQSGDLCVLNSSSGSAVVLPSPSVGLNFPFLVSQTGGHTITAPVSTLFGAVNVAVPTGGSTLNVTAATGSTVLLTSAGSCVGDRFNLVSDGLNYYVSGNVCHYNSVVFY